jgi:hypothetical protein
VKLTSEYKHKIEQIILQETERIEKIVLQDLVGVLEKHGQEVAYNTLTNLGTGLVSRGLSGVKDDATRVEHLMGFVACIIENANKGLVANQTTDLLDRIKGMPCEKN